MKIAFSKMHGAGNDFIVIDDSEKIFPADKELIRRLCDRHYGIGADGILLLGRLSKGKDSFRMIIFNSDGSRAEMCGNGLRCSALFCRRHFKAPEKMKILTDAGRLGACVIDASNVRIKIGVTSAFKRTRIDGQEIFFGATGVPHAVKLVGDIGKADVAGEGKYLRNHKFFGKAGTNVDFVSLPQDAGAPCRVRTYERGVEAETFACGTGVAASAVCLFSFLGLKPPFRFLTLNSDAITVDIPRGKNNLCGLEYVELTGPAVEVFRGRININEDLSWN